jgi:hypothetical protein
LGLVSVFEFYELNGSSLSVGSKVYKVTFVQPISCDTFWGVPWAVTIGNRTEAEPANATLPIGSGHSTTDENESTIVFALSNGSYNYKVDPNYMFPQSGTVRVNGSDVYVDVKFETSCPAGK